MPEPKPSHPRPTCQVCGRHLPRSELVYAALLRPTLAEQIARHVPTWSEHGFICRDDLMRFRGDYVRALIERERGEVTSLEQSVIDSLARQDTLVAGIESELVLDSTLGQRIADRVATFGGSWTFLISFFAVLVAWIGLNAVALANAAFDPYPFILLNLVLSCLAAVQAPVIMMSQNRQEARDRLRSQNDYRINLKAELEIRHLHEKIDHLLQRQWERLVEIQEIQIDILNSATRNGRR
jgi:uncharacterized membrane protein